MSEREPIVCDYPRLPPELWGLVVESLPREDQRSCLSVSTTFHDLACRLLFSRIVIHYGIWSAQGHEPILSESELALVTWRNNAATEILQHIARNAQFARSVKAISVLANQTGRRAGDSDSYFESRLLIHYACEESMASDHIVEARMVIALESLPHLQVFQWYGFRPPLSSLILGALTRTAGSSLTKLDICGVVGINEDASPYLTQLKSLHTLSLAGDTHHFPISTGHGGDFQSMLAACAQHVPVTLLHLSIWRDAVWAIPLRVLSGLQELSIMNPSSLARLGLIFTHCAQLRSLSMTAVGDDSELEVLAALQATPDALPHLTSFKLILWAGAFIADPGPFIEFFENKKGMRRLDLQLNHPLDGLDNYTRFLDIFAHLPRLEVVGLELRGLGFCREHLGLLDKRLPLGLSALLLKWSTYTSNASESVIYPQDWINMLKRRPSLGYVHILYSEHDLSLGRSLDLCKPLLKNRPQALRLVGHGPQIRSIVRDPATGESTYGPPWSDAAVSLGAAEDFGCDDWAWLIRYYTPFVRRR